VNDSSSEMDISEERTTVSYKFTDSTNQFI